MQGFLTEQARIVPAILPKDITGSAQTGDWINLKNHRKVAIVIQQGAWAGGTPAVTLQQATSNAGAGAKALNFTRKFSEVGFTEDDLIGTDVVSGTFNLPNVANTCTVLEVHVSDLDMNNGFTHIALQIASPGANADLLSAMYVLYEPSYACKPQTTAPSVID